ncbi:transposase [Streptomyces sp. M7]|nr:transposase [Streptomyces sp. M7]
MRDGEISEAAWAVIEPLLPPAGRARGRWRDHRRVLEGIVFKFRTGVRTSGGESRTGQPLGRLPDLASLVHVAQRGPQRLLGGGAADTGSVRAVELAALRVGAGGGQ